MSEHTREPWSIREEIDGRNAGWMTWIMGGDKGVAVCNNQARAATFRASKNESEANARHIVRCVNYHEWLVEALRAVDWEKAASWGIVDMNDADKARTLLAKLQADKGGE